MKAPDTFWAKHDPSNSSTVHLLEHHLADVGASFEALIRNPVTARRLAHSANRERLDDVTTARLAVLAALHDIGKISIGFQSSVWTDEDWPDGQAPSLDPGHQQTLIPLLNGNAGPTGERFLNAIGWERMRNWDDQDGTTTSALFTAALSHHGRPVDPYDTAQTDDALWQPAGCLDPIAQAARIGSLLTHWWPQAFQDGPPLPPEPQFQHTFLGLCALADWIGSWERHFPYRNRPDETYIHQARRQAAGATAEAGLDTRYQRTISAKAKTNDAPAPPHVTVITAPPGRARRERALQTFTKLYGMELVDGVHLAIPDGAPTTEPAQHLQQLANAMFPPEARPTVATAGPRYSPNATNHDQPWAAQEEGRVMAAQLAIGTINDAILSAQRIRHAHLKSVCLSRNLLVIEGAEYITGYAADALESLIEAQAAAGGYVAILSNPTRRPTGPATPPESAGRGDRIERRPIRHQPLEIARIALDAARNGLSAWVIRNTLQQALATQDALERLATADGDLCLVMNVHSKPTLHHPHFAAGDRALVDQAAQQARIVISTPHLAITSDAQCDLMVTDPCGADDLAARTGRIRPNGTAAPACIILTDPAGPGTAEQPPPEPAANRRRNLIGRFDAVRRDAGLLDPARRSDNAFPPGKETSIRERLGKQRVNLKLAQPILSPLDGASISVIPAPAEWLTQDIPKDPVESAQDGATVQIDVNGARLTYDRLGLRPATVR